MLKTCVYIETSIEYFVVMSALLLPSFHCFTTMGSCKLDKELKEEFENEANKYIRIDRSTKKCESGRFEI